MPVPTDVHQRIREIEAVDAVQGLTELAPDRVERTARNWQDPVRAGAAYFRVPDRRMPRGRIALLQNGQNAVERVMYRDYVLLRQYGGYHGANHPADWQLTDPYLGIVQRDGLAEFDAEQVLDLFWHYRPGRDDPPSRRLIWEKIDWLTGQGMSEPEAVYAVLPQIDGYDLTRHTCEACGPDRLFRDAESVRQHRSIMHPSDVQAVGTREAIAQALQGGGGNADLAQALNALVEQNRVLMELLAQQQPPRRGRPPAAE